MQDPPSDNDVPNDSDLGAEDVEETPTSSLEELPSALSAAGDSQPKPARGIAEGAVKLYSVIVKRPVAVTMVALAFSLFGLVAFSDLPIKLMPDLSYPTLTIRTDYPTAHPKQVEEVVSEPIQDRIGNIEGLKGHSSTSRQEQSDIVLEFEWGTNMLDASARVQEAINRVRLDNAVETPQILRFDPAQDPIMRLMLYSSESGRTLAELRKFAEDRLKPELSKLDGVATVRVSGGLKQRLKITPYPNRLAQYGLEVADIRSVCQAENIDNSVGLVEDAGRTVLLRVTSRFRSKADIENLIIPVRRGAGSGSAGTGNVKLSEVADVSFEAEDPESITRYANNRTEFESQEGVLLEVLKMGDANIIEV
ncbi:MAG: efflux RND transporter permease subunit, partial [Planctomycetes bacterium]|nr:efflux RND transporter permease subunit [Planctomycetota bacterium]